MVMTRMPEAGQFARHRQGHADHATLGGRIRGLTDLAFVGGDAGGVDDHAALAVFARRVVLHDLGGGLGHVEAADQVHHHGAGELLERHCAFLAQHASRAEDAGAVDRGIEPAEEVPGRVQVGLHAGLVGDVGAEVARVAGAEFGHGGRALVVVDVEQRDPGAARNQMLGNGQAEAGNATGDDGAHVGNLHGIDPWKTRARIVAPGLPGGDLAGPGQAKQAPTCHTSGACSALQFP
jgi:hypothetical protein